MKLYYDPILDCWHFTENQPTGALLVTGHCIPLYDGKKRTTYDWLGPVHNTLWRLNEAGQPAVAVGKKVYGSFQPS